MPLFDHHPTSAGTGLPPHAVSPIREPDDEPWRRLRWLDAVVYARDLIEAVLDATLVVGPDGIVSDVNAAAEEMARLPRDRLVGADVSDCFTAGVAVRQVVRQALVGGAVRGVQWVMRRADGGSTDVTCSIAPYRDATGTVRGVFIVARDCTDLRQAQLQMQFQASYDALTALPNRRHFCDCVERAIAQSRRSLRLVAIMLLDLDGFKDVNDTVGHAAGDHLLKDIGGRLAQALRAGDTVARIGGDEFAVLLEDMARMEDVEALADKLRHTVADPMMLEGREIALTCSIGISIFSGDAGGADTLLRNADTAMYRAKAAGKNGYQCFTADMNAAVQRRIDLGNRLRGALRRGELSLRYQPRICLSTGAIAGVEALVRWHAEDIGMVPPAEFIPIAEDTGLILPIGAWVLAEACRQAVQWRTQNGIDLPVAVNLSARQFRDEDIVAAVARVLDESGLPPRLLELELTESMLMRDAPRAADTMTRLKAAGVRIAIDDFGTGYSSLNYLKRFPLDYLKIDRSFVMDVPGDRNDETIVRAIVALAHSLGQKVIAEGVETAEQMAFLQKTGCDEAQGYLISRPGTPSDLLPLFLAGRFEPSTT